MVRTVLQEYLSAWRWADMSDFSDYARWEGNAGICCWLIDEKSPGS
jgi:hypothetical protein